MVSLRHKITRIRNHPEIRRYIANTSWLMVEKIVRMFVGLFVGIWVARYLGPGKFGLLSYAQSFVILFTAISTLGLDSIVVRELVKGELQNDFLLGTAFGLKFIGAILILPLLWLAVQFTSNDQYTNLLIFIIASAAIFQSFNVIDLFYQSKVLSKYVSFANGITLFLSSTIKIALILCKAPLTLFAMMALFDSIVLAIALIFFSHINKHLALFDWKFEWRTAKELLKDSWPLILSGLVISVYMKIDQIMIKEMLSTDAVGQYAAAVRISETWYFIPVIIASSVFPAIVEAKKNSEQLYFSHLQNLYTLMVWMAIFVALPVSMISPWLIGFLFGNDYLEAASVLIVHIWAGVFVFLGVAFGKFLAAENFTKKAFYRTLSGAVINITINLFLIPSYGILGAAVATLISQISANYLYDWFDGQLRHLIVLKHRAFFPIYLVKENQFESS